MRLTNDNFSYCKGVGLLKENFTRERALKSIYKDMEETPDLDRAFLREVGKATTTSSNVGTWVAVMYNYDIDVNYKKGGKTYNKKINDFGNTGTPDELDVTEYYGDGDYKTLTDVASQCSFPVWNKNNIFTFEEMKGALKSIIEDELPSGWQSYETVDWNVSAYLVPIFSIDIDIYGKTYTINYNLHNGHYHYTYPVDKQLLKKKKAAKTWGAIIPIACLVVSCLAALLSFAGTPDNKWRAIFAAAAAIYNIVMIVKFKKSESYYQSYYSKHPDEKVSKTLMLPLIGIAITVVLSFIALL